MTSATTVRRQCNESATTRDTTPYNPPGHVTPLGLHASGCAREGAAFKAIPGAALSAPKAVLQWELCDVRKLRYSFAVIPNRLGLAVFVLENIANCR
jgi:hypothetical protein